MVGEEKDKGRQFSFRQSARQGTFFWHEILAGDRSLVKHMSEECENHSFIHSLLEAQKKNAKILQEGSFSKGLGSKDDRFASKIPVVVTLIVGNKDINSTSRSKRFR